MSYSSGWEELGAWADYEHHGRRRTVPIAANVSPRAAHHILYGAPRQDDGSAEGDNAWDGGHLGGQNRQDKSMFPSHWSPRRIIDIARGVMEDPTVRVKGQPGGVRFKTTTVDGLQVVVKLGPNDTIETFYPHVGAGVTWSWNGEVFPQETWEQYIANKRHRNSNRE